MSTLKNIKTYLIASLLLLVLPACSQEKYPGWKKGEMDIHFIYTGRGEATFYIFPDGTTMLADVGDCQAGVPMTDPKPNLSRRAGEWVARYILKVNPNAEHIDYYMLSHFHDDHMGSAALDAPMTNGRMPDYKLIGIAEAGEYLRFGHFIDRGFPNYDYPQPVSDSNTCNYRCFVSWQKRKYNARQEAFRVGEKNQIALQKKPKKYASHFSIRNIAANGEVWNGTEGSTTRYYDMHPDNLSPNGNENTKSIALRIEYGPFAYFTGGDISCGLLDADGNSVNIESEAGKACGEVDVCKCNHHAFRDAMHPDFLRHVNAQVYINPVWDQYHTQPEIIARMLNQDRKAVRPNARHTMYLSQYIVEDARRKYASEEWMQKTCPYDGHIVVKVYDKGERYKIYRLSAEDENMAVLKVYGPFLSKKVER